MADLPAQMTQAAARKPALVTVMTGANDACRDSVSAMTSVADFRASFEKALRTLRTAAPKSQVYVASVPDLKRLWSQGRGNALGKMVWKLGICPSMLGDPDAVDTAATTRRDEVQGRVEAYNSVLQEVCATDRLCRFDGGRGLRLRLRDAAAEPLGLVPSEPRRAGAAGRDRVPRGHRREGRDLGFSHGPHQRALRHASRRHSRPPLDAGAGRGPGARAVVRRDRAVGRGSGPGRAARGRGAGVPGPGRLSGAPGAVLRRAGGPVREPHRGRRLHAGRPDVPAGAEQRAQLLCTAASTASTSGCGTRSRSSTGCGCPG